MLQVHETKDRTTIYLRGNHTIADAIARLGNNYTEFAREKDQAFLIKSQTCPIQELASYVLIIKL